MSFMTLRTFLETIGTNYRRTDGTSSESAQLIRAAPKKIGHLVTAGYTTKGSAGSGAGARCPWVAIFDPDETNTATRGMYVVYLFAADMKTVALSLNQGVTELTKIHGAPKARGLLRSEADAIFAELPTEKTKGLDSSIDLKSTAELPKAYEAGNIAARVYDTNSLPPEHALQADLTLFVQLYQNARVIRRYLSITQHNKIHTREAPQRSPHAPLAHFAPKDDRDYEHTIKSQRITKSRKHETLIRQYGETLIRKGLTVATNVHPRDMTLYTNDDHWLLEAKIVRQGNASEAVREAIGQLIEYSHFLYPEDDKPRKVALFNETIGDAFVEMLEINGIAAVWGSPKGWIGSPSAINAKLV